MRMRNAHRQSHGTTKWYNHNLTTAHLYCKLCATQPASAESSRAANQDKLPQRRVGRSVPDNGLSSQVVGPMVSSRILSCPGVSRSECQHPGGPDASGRREAAMKWKHTSVRFVHWAAVLLLVALVLPASLSAQET